MSSSLELDKPHRSNISSSADYSRHEAAHSRARSAT